jgi:transposase-like protein
VLLIDSTFLTGKYKGTILVAIAADINNQLLPIVYSLVEGENKDSWLWFLSCLKNRVVKQRPDVCIISDRNSGLLNVPNTIKQVTDPEWGWLDLETRWCMRHLAANFYTKFKNKDWFKLFKRMCMQNTESKMNAIWTGINGEIERAALPSREGRRGQIPPVNLT